MGPASEFLLICLMDMRSTKTPRRGGNSDDTEFRAASGTGVSEELATKAAHTFQVGLYFSRKPIS